MGLASSYICKPRSNASLMLKKSIIEWYMTTLVIRKGHHKDMCYDEIGLCAQNKDITLGSQVNTFRGPMSSLEEK